MSSIWNGIGQDLRASLRALRLDHGFALTAALVLGLGIGANTAVFSIVNTLWLKPLPFRALQRLAWIAAGGGTGGLSDVTFTVAGMEEYQHRNHSFAAVTAYQAFFGDSDYTLTGSGEPEEVAAVMVAGDFFPTLGVRPLLGRLFTRQEAQSGGPPAALLSYAFWRRRFAGNPRVVGSAITLNQRRITVVGVLPRSFDFGAVFAPGQNMQVFVPAVMDSMRRWGHTLALIGELRPGVTTAQAQAEANSLAPQIRAERPDAAFSERMAIGSLKDHVSGKMRRSLLVLWGAVGMVLLIVCVNVSNLLLARAMARSKEFAVRLALGAGRGRLARQLLTESLILCVAGAALGLGMAEAMVAYLARQGSLALPLLSQAKVDGRGLAWAVFITGGTAALIGLAPGLKLFSNRGNLQQALQASGSGAGESREHGRWRANLAIGEVALACMLLAAAGLLLRSFSRVSAVDVGFQPSQAAVLETTYGSNNPALRSAYLEAILQRVRAIPGIEVAGIGDLLPLDRNRSWGLWPQGEVHPDGVPLSTLVHVVTPGYLRAIGTPLLEGRDFSWGDAPNRPAVVIVSQSAARRYWPDESPVGRKAMVAGHTEAEVIGVAADVRENSVESASGPEMYVAASQFGPEGAELVVRSTLPPAALTPEVLKALREINPNQPTASLQPLEGLVDRATSPRRFLAWLVASFAATGMLLAGLGIYGVISYGVIRRRREIGTRMALGASPGHVQLLVVRDTLRLTLTGVGLGGVLALTAARLLSPLLFGISAADPASFLAATTILTAVAVLAGYLPAWRAAHLPPMEALRTV